MELKVWVDGVQRVICGVTEKTTCQEVVIALAQAMGRTGRYTLKEKFKEFERNVTSDEKLLESLNKYGQQASEVQLILKHNGPSLETRRCSQIRGTRGAARSLHRQSLPALDRVQTSADPKPEEKKAKRKSLTFAEEAREWIESFTRTRLHRVRGKGRDAGRRDSSVISQPVEEAGQIIHLQNSREISSKEGNLPRITDDQEEESSPGQAAKEELHHLIRRQQAQLETFQSRLDATEAQIRALEEQESLAKEIARLGQLVESRAADVEEVDFWENELRAEEVYEQDLQEQFLEMKEKVQECKGKLEEYKKRESRHGSRADQADRLTGELSQSCKEGSRMENSLALTQEADQDFQVRHSLQGAPFPRVSYRFSDTSGSPGPLREWVARWSEELASSCSAAGDLSGCSDAVQQTDSTAV
ncbi:ras association domain-containing protein 8-like [Acipenser oxyrinchus oxyrinchus]|uniref:Ras association domain-containing protein 8-like n=1 Tax=Acipenser oxyrinchus oxyrinchus TaxID=40147 RepID=A0AAD8CJJ4_ACIOX|nr:ras association domain-containing protein 8-like [Acipenser oxyrinchus oxyrinchus]